MSRISQVFEAASRESRMAFMPFVTAGDPDLAGTAGVLLALPAIVGEGLLRSAERV